MFSVRLLLAFVFFYVSSAGAGQPVFDVHIHYSHDVWDPIPPQKAIAKLRAAGITRAMVSSSSDEGTQMLYKEAPDLVVPALRPYRRRGELETWMRDATVIPYLEERLAKYKYAAIGEFHLDGAEADLPVPRRLVQLAKENKLILHAHVDADAVNHIFAQDPDARILWAHAGFEDAAIVRQMMDRYDNLWADLSFRYDAFPDTKFLPQWRELLMDHSNRFMLGVDTYTPLRWLQVQEVMDWYRRMFAALPPEVAEKIRYKNAERVIKWN